MLKAPVPGRVKTRLAVDLGAAEACAAYQRLAEHQMAQIPRDWRVVVHFDPPGAEAAMRDWLGARASFRPQVSGDLGARLTAALADHDFSAGPLFFLGGDCPYLDAGALARAREALDAGCADVVLVPALDGGYVLIGMRRPHPALFAGMDWSTDRVLRQTLEQAARLDLRVARLDPMEDVDDLPSWQRAQRQLNRS